MVMELGVNLSVFQNRPIDVIGPASVYAKLTKLTSSQLRYFCQMGLYGRFNGFRYVH